MQKKFSIGNWNGNQICCWWVREGGGEKERGRQRGYLWHHLQRLPHGIVALFCYAFNLPKLPFAAEQAEEEPSRAAAAAGVTTRRPQRKRQWQRQWQRQRQIQIYVNYKYELETNTATNANTNTNWIQNANEAQSAGRKIIKIKLKAALGMPQRNEARTKRAVRGGGRRGG